MCTCLWSLQRVCPERIFFENWSQCRHVQSLHFIIQASCLLLIVLQFQLATCQLPVSFSLHLQQSGTREMTDQSVNQFFSQHLTYTMSVWNFRVRILRRPFECSINLWTGTPYMFRGSVSTRNLMDYHTLSHSLCYFYWWPTSSKNSLVFLKETDKTLV